MKIIFSRRVIEPLPAWKPAILALLKLAQIPKEGEPLRCKGMMINMKQKIIALFLAAFMMVFSSPLGFAKEELPELEQHDPSEYTTSADKDEPEGPGEQPDVDPVGPVNYALSANGATVATSGSVNETLYPEASIINGERAGNGWGAGSGGWNSTGVPAWVEITFAKKSPINQINVFTVQDNNNAPQTPTLDMEMKNWGIVDFEVMVEVNGMLETVPGGLVTGNTKVWRQFTFPTVYTNKIYISITNVHTGDARVVEVEGIYDPALDSSAVHQKPYVDLLSQLGIAKGYEDGSMGLDREVTRAEFTALVLRTLGIQAQNVASQDGYAVFDDVPFSHWAYGDIQMASDMGLINGVGGRMFSPQSPVTCQDALKIFVSALGFGEMAQAKGGYPYGYITMGRQAGLLEGVSAQAAEALNRDGVFCMVYNALNADNYQTVALGEGNISKELGKPLLKTNFNLDRYKNVLVSSVGQNGLGGAQDYADAEVVAGGVVFTSRTIDMAPYLGEKVTLFADEENEIVFVMPGEETKEITVAADRISDKTTTSKFVYENEDGKEVSLSLSGDLTVIYNQRNVAFPRAEDLKIKNGQVTLKSTTGKSTYDLVKVEAFETVYVKSIRIPILELTDYNGSVYRFANDEENTLEVYRGGAKAAFRDIQLQSVVSVYPSKTQANSYVKLQISTAKLTGTVNRVKKDEIGVGNNTYKLSQYFRQNGGVMPKVGDSVTCRMNHLGEIVVIENAGRVSDSSYGYLLDWSNVKAFGANAKLKMFVSSGKETVYELSPEVKLNGKDTTSSEILSLAAQNQYMPVRFKLDKEGKIKDIAFKEAGLTLATVELQWPNQPKYNAAYPGFTASNGAVYKIGKETFFMAAGIRNDVAMTNYWVDEDELYVMTPELRAKMVNGMVVDTLYAADPAADGTCGMIVMNPLKTVKPGIILDMSEFAPYSIFDTYTHSLFMVNGMTQGLNSEDEVVDMVEGLIDGEEKSFELAEYVAYEVLNQNPSAKPSRGYTDWTAETDFNGREPGLEPGDVIAVTFNMRGQIDNVLKICNAAAPVKKLSDRQVRLTEAWTVDMGVVTSADMSTVVLSGENSRKRVTLTSQRLYQWSVKKQCFEMGERENVTGSYKKRSENSTEDDNVWLLINSLNRGITEAVLMAEE